mgnify:FL=1
MKTQKILTKSICICLGLAAFGMTMNNVSAKPLIEGVGDVIIGNVYYDCGTDASYCPSAWTTNEYAVAGEQYFKDVVGSKPIPTKPGAEFVDWEIVTLPTTKSPEVPEYNGNKLQVGDQMTDWDSYQLSNFFGENQGITQPNIYLKAVWKESSSKESSIPIKVTIPAATINVTIPTTIELVFDGSSVNAVVASNFSITNNSNIGNIKVTNVKGKMNDASWSFNSDSADSTYKNLPLNSKQLYLGFGKDASSVQAITEEGIDPQIKLGPSSTTTKSQSFIIQSKTGGSSQAIDSEIINLEFTLAFEREPVEISIDSASVQAMGVKSPWYSNEDNTTFGWEAPELGEMMPLKYVSSTKGFTSSIDITFTLPSPGTITYYINEPDLTYFHENNVYFEWITEGFDGFSAGYNEIKLDAGTYTIYGGVYSTTTQPTTFPESLVETIYIEDIKIVLD